MQGLQDILGPTGVQIVQFLALLALVLFLVFVIVLLMRFFMGTRMALGFKRNRVPRLSIVDALPIDSRRRLVLVRRDHFEHLLLVGGDTDLVVEETIFRGLSLNVRIRPDQLRAATAATETGQTAPAASANAAGSRAPLARGAAAPVGPQPPPFLRRAESGAARAEAGRQSEASPRSASLGVRAEPPAASPGISARQSEPRARTPSRPPSPEAAAPGISRAQFEAPPINASTATSAPHPVAEQRRPLGEPNVEVEPSRPALTPAEATIERSPPPMARTERASPPALSGDVQSASAQIDSLEQEMARLLGELTTKKSD